MGKYDDLIGGCQITISVDDILAEQDEAIDVRRSLVEQLIKLTEEDIKERNHRVFRNEDWAKKDKEYLGRFLTHLKEYLQWL